MLLLKPIGKNFFWSSFPKPFLLSGETEVDKVTVTSDSHLFIIYKEDETEVDKVYDDCRYY